MTTKTQGETQSTTHRLIQGNTRSLSFIPDESVHLVVTSPPYWSLKRYNENPAQLGHIADYEHFLSELTKVWKEVFRVLVPGGRLVCVVGDVCLSRREHGRHLVMPLHADITVICRRIGFDNLNPIIWPIPADVRNVATDNIFCRVTLYPDRVATAARRATSL